MAEAVGFEPTCPCGQLHFECSSLQPLRYASMYKYSLSGTNHMISSAAPSTTRTTLRVYFRPVFFPEICSKIRWRENRRDGKKYSILRFSVLRNIKENQGDEIPSFCRNFECCKTLADSRLEQAVMGRFVKRQKRRRRKGLRTFRPVSARGDSNRPKVQIKPRSCVKSLRSCAFARSQARKQRPRQHR